MLGAGCASSGRSEPDTYVVQPKDTLYSVAWRHDLDYHDLARWNHIGPDYRISVGQVLVLKPGGRGAPAARSPPGAASPPHEASSASGSAPSSTSKLAAMPGSRCAGSGRPSVRRRLGRCRAAAYCCSGQLGQVVRAACAGRVVYVGNGLRGYGNLAIIKHGDNLLSAYAHNSELWCTRARTSAAENPSGAWGLRPIRLRRCISKFGSTVNRWIRCRISLMRSNLWIYYVSY